MKKFLVISCIVVVYVFYAPIEWIIALLLIIFGAIALFSPLLIAACQCRSPILYMEEIENDIINTLDREKRLSKQEGWLTFNQIFESTELSDMNRSSRKNGYYIALSNLIRKNMVECDSIGGEHFYRLVVEIDGTLCVA